MGPLPPHRRGPDSFAIRSRPRLCLSYPATPLLHISKASSFFTITTCLGKDLDLAQSCLSTVLLGATCAIIKNLWHDVGSDWLLRGRNVRLVLP